MVVRHNYTRNPKTAKAGLRYYQMRPRGVGEPPRSIFTREGSITRDTAYRMMEEHQLDGRFLVHRIVLAPADSEAPEDLREMTRQMMRELEKDRGQHLHWVAIEHRHTEHHHVHVMLFGGTETQGGVREVRLDRTDHSRLRAEGGEYCSWEREERAYWQRALAGADELDQDIPRAEPEMAADAEGISVPGRGTPLLEPGMPMPADGDAPPAPRSEPLHPGGLEL